MAASSSPSSSPRFIAKVVKCASITAPAHVMTSRAAGRPFTGSIARSTLPPSPPEYASSHTDRYATSLAAASGGRSGNASVAYSGVRGRATREWSVGAQCMPSKDSTAAVAIRAR